MGQPGIVDRIKHLRGKEDLRHASLQEFREEDHADSTEGD
jgi:bifunctional non-homologous end joining protein LigD